MRVSCRIDKLADYSVVYCLSRTFNQTPAFASSFTSAPYCAHNRERWFVLLMDTPLAHDFALSANARCKAGWCSRCATSGARTRLSSINDRHRGCI